MSEPRYFAPATLCVHGGYRATAESKAVVPPVVRSATFLLDDEAYALRAAGRGSEALIYTRETNPTVQATEARLAALEGAERALLYSSGMAAMHALLLATLEGGAGVSRPELTGDIGNTLDRAYG